MKSFPIAPAAQETIIVPSHTAAPGVCVPYTYREMTLDNSFPDQGLGYYIPYTERSSFFRPSEGKWSKIRKSGVIKMTPMHVVNERTEQFLGSYNAHSVKSIVEARSLHCADDDVEANQPPVEVLSHLVQPRTLSLMAAKSRHPHAPHYRAKRAVSENAIEAQKAAAWQELFQAYNLGEELYELRESIAQITSLMKRSVNLIAEGKRVYERIRRNRGHDEALKYWMEYRYGIMPIVYSIQDIIGLSNEKGLYRTVRKRVRYDVSDPDLPDSGTFFFDKIIDESRISITVKSRYATEALKRSDLVNVNPFTTAAAVYPWAMVVRWFINLNSFLDAHLKSLTTAATQFSGVIAFKDTYTEETHFRFHSRIDPFERTDTHWRAGNTATVKFDGVDEKTTHLLQKRTVDNYRREIIHPSNTRLVFAPYLDWKRGIDSIALTLPLMRSALGGLLR